MSTAASAKPKPERIRRTVGEIGDAGMSVQLILVGEGTLRRGLTEYLAHYHGERNHQGKDNLLLFPPKNELQGGNGSTVRCRQRLGGLLNYYARAA